MTQLTAHFTLDEAQFSSTAARLGINNTVPEGLTGNVKHAAHGMECVRAILRNPVHVDSWYRCVRLNQAIGGSRASAHMQGYAVDFVCPAFGTPLEIVRAIAASELDFDQCIQEGRWVHISFDPANRKQVLTAHFGIAGTTYTTGLT